MYVVAAISPMKISKQYQLFDEGKNLSFGTLSSVIHIYVTTNCIYTEVL